MSDRGARRLVDLRSDTVTRPTDEMRRAMAAAEVGDDVLGDDPTVRRLETMAAEMMGKESAMFFPTGTMANLAAVLTHCERGDEVILGKRSHTFLYEKGGIAALGGVHPNTIDNLPDGTIDLDELDAAVRDCLDVHQPRTRLICLENTHNSCGGVPLSEEYTNSVKDLARKRGIVLHIDGARIFNAAVSLGVDVAALAAPADSVMFCLSKGLSAPAGSLLAGQKGFIERARHTRKQLGGGMRQVGVLAAPGIVALGSMVRRLEDDHRRARALAEELRKIERIVVDPEHPRTNMVFIRLDGGSPEDVALLKAALERDGVQVSFAGRDRLRMVTHFGIEDADIRTAVDAFRANAPRI